MIEFYLFRHGETDWNVERRFQGHIDVPLNDRGREQARLLITQFRRRKIETILSSDLSRARETAEIIARETGIPVFQDSGLREAHLGKAQGLTWLEIEKEFGRPLADRWQSHEISDADISYPGGETGNQVLERFFASLERFTDEKHAQGMRYQRIGIATHGGVIRRTVQRLVMISNPHTPYVPIPNGVLYLLRYEKDSRRWRFEPHMPL